MTTQTTTQAPEAAPRSSGAVTNATVADVTATTFIAGQADGESLVRAFLGASVRNAQGETVGDIYDLVFDHSGRISTVVLGVGGFLGMGEKTVAIPFAAMTFASESDGTRSLVVAIDKDELMHAPTFRATEKTTLDNVRELAVGLGHKASETVGGLKDQAVKKIGDLNRDMPKLQ